MNERRDDGKLYSEQGIEIGGKEIDVDSVVERLRAMSGSTTAQEAAEVITRFRRLLLPIYMVFGENAIAGEAFRDEQPVFTFMGSGASDATYTGEFRALMGDERKTLKDYNG